MKGGYVEFSVFFACISFIFHLYAILTALLGLLAHLFIFAISSCAIFAIVYHFRVPKPSYTTVRNVFGSDWGAYSSTPDDNPCDNEYIMKVIAHRACGLDAPENSLSAVRQAAKAGIKTVEFDVLLTSDDVPIVFHDLTLNRMTECHGGVEEIPYRDLQKLDISVNHPFAKNFPKEKIPTLDEYVRYCLDNQIRMVIDLKGTKKEIVKAINDIFKKYPEMYDNAIVSAFDPIVIYKIRSNDPKIVCSIAWRPYYYSHEDFSAELGPIRPRTNNLFLLFYFELLNHFHQWALWKFGFYILGISALLLHKNLITREVVKYWKKKGVRVVAWTVNLPTEKQYYEKIMEITYLTDTAINS